MAKLNKLHQARWDFARCLFRKIVDTANREKAMLMFNGSLIETSAIQITDGGIYVTEDRTTFIQFEADPDRDHGLFDTVASFETRIRWSFVIVKTLEY